MAQNWKTELDILNKEIAGMSKEDPGYADSIKFRNLVRQKLINEDAGITDKELDSNIASSYSTLSKTNAKIASDFKNVLTPILNIGESISDISIGKQQQAQGRAELEGLTKPKGIGKYERSDLLKSQIRDAQANQSQVGTDRLTAGLKQDILSNYDNQLNQAKTSSAGQAGAYGSYSQAANNQRLRGAMNLQAERERIRRGEGARLDNLAQMQIGEDAQASSHARLRAEQAAREYSEASRAAGGAVRDGIINARTGRRGLIDAFGSAVNENVLDMFNQSRPMEARDKVDTGYNPYVRPKYNVELDAFTDDSSFMKYGDKFGMEEPRYGVQA